jgi:hypothetical protein
LRTDLEEQKKLRTDFEKKFTLAQADVKKVQTQLKDLEAKKAELETKVSDLEVKTSSGVELGTIVVNPEVPAVVSGAVSRPPLNVPQKAAPEKKEKATQGMAMAAGQSQEVKVLVINKDYNFLVMSLGSKDGANVGSQYSVFHNNKFVGDVQIEKVHESMSAAGFLTPGMKDKIYEGDKVVPKTK